MKEKLYAIIEKANAEKKEAEKVILYADAKIEVANEMLLSVDVEETPAEEVVEETESY